MVKIGRPIIVYANNRKIKYISDCPLIQKIYKGINNGIDKTLLIALLPNPTVNELAKVNIMLVARINMYTVIIKRRILSKGIAQNKNITGMIRVSNIQYNPECTNNFAR